MLRAMQYEHPNNGWTGITTPCDARNFKILMDWDVRTEFTMDEMHFDFGGSSQRNTYRREGMDLFKIGMVRQTGKIIEFACSGPFSSMGEHMMEVRVPTTESIAIYPALDLKCLEVEVFMTCPSSDPTGMPMPLKTPTGKMWLIPIPEEVFGFKGAFVRLKI